MGATAEPVQESRRAAKCSRYGLIAKGALASRTRAAQLIRGTGPAGFRSCSRALRKIQLHPKNTKSRQRGATGRVAPTLEQPEDRLSQTHQQAPAEPTAGRLVREFPSHLVPERYRWSVFNGLVYLADGGGAGCRIVHPTVCPALDHDDDPVLRGLRRSYAVTTRKWIHERAFVPAPRKVLEENVVEQLVQAGPGPRHVITYTCWTWLAPSSLDQIRCVAIAASTGERCKKTVLSDDLYERHWTQVDIPVPPGRAGQNTLWAEQKMWVYDLNALYPDQYKRWRDQHCPEHFDSSAPDATVPQWVVFDTFRHSDFITYERPKITQERRREDHPLLGLLRPVSTGSQCSGESCTNRSHRKEQEGWLCWTCTPLARRRARIHEKWQAPPPEDEPPFCWGPALSDSMRRGWAVSSRSR
ncbi:DUF6083 domain-containing protein [Streptomyces sp. HNM0663]|uniref:DUF6083 domain-containing protein n=1 Tax=Streptomyces chengmaiensis TaxID=3040919 RepID=A0ABT6HU01_9ACTN|nr:DUF6083 domain-containing protein [Streptomyces chengmaiensis]MDH2392203.1 DUF6083 domain-containing protein [Streptomyces chengmaiensis]